MTKEQIALSRRAVASGRWQWAPGALDQFGRRVINVWPDDLGIKWSHIPENCVVRDADALPDLSDAATLGCLLALVREAWGDYHAYLAPGPGWFVGSGSRNAVYGEGATEAEALVVALERAP